MLITFETKAYANITMFGDVAIKLIKSMGHSGAVPGVIQIDDLPKALEQLQSSVRAEMAIDQDCEQGQASDDSENYVSIDKRARPLIELLEAAIEQNTDVLWDE
ncbi:MAG: DUF1840 family protein [Gammaproteobacteria bacterium]|nr:MAG: DUF1840 family protein [Gammaproteobacteria bacterium]